MTCNWILGGIVLYPAALGVSTFRSHFLLSPEVSRLREHRCQFGHIAVKMCQAVIKHFLVDSAAFLRSRSMWITYFGKIFWGITYHCVCKKLWITEGYNCTQICIRTDIAKWDARFLKTYYEHAFHIIVVTGGFPNNGQQCGPLIISLLLASSSCCWTSSRVVGDLKMWGCESKQVISHRTQLC